MNKNPPMPAENVRRKPEALRTARALYKEGWAVIWLHPRSKRPLESGWTTGERKPWVYLESTYREGYNVGVRTGSPSRVAGKYLACIDIDIQDPECLGEAMRAVKKLTGGKSLPEVRTGSGNGSRHLYCRTDRPFKMITVAKSADKVLVDGKKKHRFEVCVYSDGRQMVLPPSIHPSGKPYLWKKPLDGLPELDFSGVESLTGVAGDAGSAGMTSDASSGDGGVAGDSKRTEREALGASERSGDAVLKDFKVEPVEVEWLPISKAVLDGITIGTGVRDRSGYLLVASSALVSAGLSTNEVLTVLTDPSTYLGACAYEHAQTKDRARAAAWVYRYTLKKVADERDAVAIFSRAGELAPARILTAEEIAVQTEELLEGTWRSEDHGFYLRGPKGKLAPDYPALFNAFAEERPFKTIADMKAVYTFNGTHYVDCTPIEIRGFAEDKFYPKPEERMRSEFYSKVIANNISRRAFFTESTEGRINFKNGVLDLNRSDTDLLDHSPDFGFRGVLPYEFDPFASCPIFRNWINEIMLGDEELISVLQEYMGYVVRGGDYKYHKALWLGGVGRNGKSTFVDLLKALIGSGNFSVLSIRALMGDKFAGADLDGKIANFSEETSPQELADSGPFKNLTGDGDLFAQKKYGDPYSFRNRAKLIMTYNEIPDLKDLSPGMMSRPLIVPFLKIIKDGEQDRSIKKKLFGELSGIFNFALDGWRRLEAQEGFTYSEKSDLALQKIKEESCGVYQWIENHIEFTKGVNAETVELGHEETYRPADLYSIYSRQEKYAFKAPAFFRKLNAHPEILKRKKVLRNYAFYFGFKVR